MIKWCYSDHFMFVLRKKENIIMVLIHAMTLFDTAWEGENSIVQNNGRYVTVTVITVTLNGI